MIGLIDKARAGLADFTEARRELAERATQREDLRAIAELVEPGSRVLDIGCGDGELLALLAETRSVDARGMELSQRRVNEAVARGLSVVQGDADVDLGAYPDDGFDTVILSRTIQATRAPEAVLREMLRIGRRVIVSFPNFGHWRNRMQLMFGGHMPVTEFLDYAWYETPNIHFCTVSDFLDLSEIVDARLECALAFTARGRPLPLANRVAHEGRAARGAPLWTINLFAEQALMVLRRD